MRAIRNCAAIGMLAWCGLTTSWAADLTGRPAKGPTPVPMPNDGVCGKHGTTVTFVESPKEAAAQAKKEQKLVFVLHVSGLFEDPRFT